MSDREELMRQARLEPDPNPREVARLANQGSTFFQLLGKLIREDEAQTQSLRNADIITEEGRFKTLKEQGRLQGRTELLEAIIDLILEGSEENDGSGTEQSEQ